MSSGVPNMNANAGSVPVGRKLEQAASKIHGAGEAIRGEFNHAANTAMHDERGAAQDRATINRGNDEMQSGRMVDRPGRNTSKVSGGENEREAYDAGYTAGATSLNNSAGGVGANVSAGLGTNRNLGTGGRLV